MTISMSIYVAANGIISFFLWLSSIPLYILICTTSSLSIHLLYHLLSKDFDILIHLLILVNFGIYFGKVHKKFISIFIEIGFINSENIENFYNVKLSHQ